jgi:uncharacterized Zn finger protein
MKIIFKVQGSKPDPYIVTFEKKENQVLADCTCDAGNMGTHCKHRINILKGISENIVSDNLNDMSSLKGILKNTKLENALNAFENAEIRLEDAKRERKKAADLLSKTMYHI